MPKTGFMVISMRVQLTVTETMHPTIAPITNIKSHCIGWSTVRASFATDASFPFTQSVDDIGWRQFPKCAISSTSLPKMSARPRGKDGKLRTNRGAGFKRNHQQLTFNNRSDPADELSGLNMTASTIVHKDSLLKFVDDCDDEVV